MQHRGRSATPDSGALPLITTPPYEGGKMTLFFRWIKKTSPDLAAAKNKKLVYSNNGKPSNKACWISEAGAAYQPGATIRKERILVAFDFGSAGDTVIKNKENHLDFESEDFKGEAQHPYKIIVKSNEPGAYGVGGAILGHIGVVSTRLASVKEIAKALGLSEREVTAQSW
jgi:hypothetical protein